MSKLVKKIAYWTILPFLGAFAGVGISTTFNPPEVDHTDSCYAIHFDDELSVFKTIEVIVIGKDEDGQETLWRYTAGRED